MSTLIGDLYARLRLDDQMTAALQKAAGIVEMHKDEWAGIGAQMTQAGSAITAGLTLPLVGVGAASLKTAIDFESAFAGVRKTVDASESELAQLSAGFRDMAKTVPASTTEILAVGEAAGQLGIAKDDILAFTRTMVDLGETTNLTADEAATATAQIQNIFGAAGVDVDRFGATLVALGNAGASTEKDIISMGLRIAGAGAQVGMSQAEVLSYASALSSVGIEAEAGGSAISRTFLTINDAVMGGGDALDEFARIAGMSAADFKVAFQQNAAGATNAFIGGLARIKGEGENVSQVLGNLELGELRVRDALLRASGASGMLSDQLALGSKAWEDNNALTEEARKRYETTEAKLGVLWNKVKDVGITLGDTFIPMLTGVVEGIEPVIQLAADAAGVFAGLPMPLQLAAVGFAGLLAAVGPVILIGGQLITAGTAIGGVLVTLTGATSGWAAAAGILTGAMSALAPVVAVAGTAFASWEIGTWIGEITGLTEGIGNLAIKVGEFIGVVPAGTLELQRQMDNALPTVKALPPAFRQVDDFAKIAAGGLALMGSSSGGAKTKGDELLATLRAQDAAFAGLDPKVKNQIAESLRLGSSVTEVAEAFGVSENAVKQFDDKLKKQAAALKETKTKADEFAASITGVSRAWTAFAPSLADAGAELQNLAAGLEGNGTLVTATIAETGKARAEALAWANANGAVLAPSIKAVNSALDEGAGKASKWASVGKGISDTILKAVTGGGNVGKSIGTDLGGQVGEWAGKKASEFIGKHVAGKAGAMLGGLAGNLLGPLGSIAGGWLGEKAGGLIGKLFGGGEGKQVKQMRADFLAAGGGIDVVRAKAEAAGLSVDKMLKAKTVKDFEAAVNDLNMGLEKKAANLQLAKTAAEEFGIPAERMGQAFKQAESDLSSGDMLAKINALVDSGVNMGTIAEFVGDDFGKLAHRAIEMGTTVPAEFKKIAASMIEQGTLVDANGEKFTDLSQIPFAETLQEQFSGLIDKLDAFIDRLGDIPSQINFDINGRVNIDGNGNGLTPMATGGIVTGPTPILAGEAGPEAIIPLSKLGAFGEQSYTVNLMVDGRKMTDVVINNAGGRLSVRGGRGR